VLQAAQEPYSLQQLCDLLTDEGVSSNKTKETLAWLLKYDLLVPVPTE
jgi:hypothetical protein